MSESSIQTAGDVSTEPTPTDLAATIVAAYVCNNCVQAADLPALIADLHAALLQARGAATAAPAVEAPKPAVPIKRSIGDDYIVCLEDGR